MGQMTKEVSGPVYGGPYNVRGPLGKPQDSRTVWKHYVMERVLPAVALLCIAALTILLLLFVVTAVADIDQRLQAHGTGDHAWQAWGADPEVGSQWQPHSEDGVSKAAMAPYDPQMDLPADMEVVFEPPQR